MTVDSGICDRGYRFWGSGARIQMGTGKPGQDRVETFADSGGRGKTAKTKNGKANQAVGLFQIKFHVSLAASQGCLKGDGVLNF